MELKLPQGYKAFSDDARYQILKLNSEGFDVASPREIMEMVVKYGKDFSNVKNKKFSSSYGTAFNSKGDVKIIKNCPEILELNFNSKAYSRNGLELSDEKFDSFNGKNILYLSKNKIKKLEEDSPFNLTPKLILDNEVWNFIAEDNSVLKGYIDFVFRGVKKEWDRDYAMGISLDSNTNGFYDCSNNILPLSFNGLGVGANISISLTYGIKFLGIKKDGEKINDLEKIAFFDKFHKSMKKGEPFLYNENIFIPTYLDKISLQNN